MSIQDKSNICLKSIGIIHTPHRERPGTPIQPAGARDIPGRVEIFNEYIDGLLDLDGFSHLILLYHFHMSAGYRLRVTPYLDDREHGLFATRAPGRPNPIGLSVVRLDRIEQGLLYVRDVDMLDGTPLLDIKPYVPDFDRTENCRTGWLEELSRRVRQHRADDRKI